MKTAAAAITMQGVFLLILILILIPNSVSSRKTTVVVTNNFTSYLTIRCFSFTKPLDSIHLKPSNEYKFKVKTIRFIPSFTMVNCSTNMGTFIAYTSRYECSRKKYDSCDWKFDDNYSYLWDPKDSTWIKKNYEPNYESLNRGGIVKGFIVNKK